MLCNNANRLLVPIFLLTLLACEKENTLPLPQGDSAGTEQAVNWCGLEVGQATKYLRFQGYQYFQAEDYDNFAYFDDTLVLEITQANGANFTISEYFTAGSPIRDSMNAWPVQWPDSVLTYQVSVSEDTLYLDFADGPYGSSRFFYSEKIPLHPLEGEADIIGWKTDLPYCECHQEAMDTSWTLFGATYENVRIHIDNRDMAVDGPGFTYLYHPIDGMLRSVTYNWWTQQGYGYDRLP